MCLWIPTFELSTSGRDRLKYHANIVAGPRGFPCPRTGHVLHLISTNPHNSFGTSIPSSSHDSSILDGAFASYRSWLTIAGRRLMFLYNVTWLWGLDYGQGYN